jgi:ribosome modulation factor
MTNNDAFDGGYRAYRDGVDFKGNPYDQEKNADEFESWIKGWREARKNDHDECAGRG